MEMRKGRAIWPLGGHLLRRSFELAFEDPALALRFAQLGLELQLFLQDGYDPFATRVKKRERRS
jgi:hypothetical protein